MVSPKWRIWSAKQWRYSLTTAISILININERIKNMKNKALTIILSTAFIACIGVSIYQLNTASALKNRLSVLRNTKNELTAEIENKTNELKNITSETQEMSNTISELTTVMENLTSLTEEMQSEIESLEAPIEDTDLGLTQEDEDEIRDMMKEILKEQYPELLTEGSTDNTGATQQGNYESVGTPSTGQFTNPNYTVGESGGEGLSTDVTVY